MQLPLKSSEPTLYDRAEALRALASLLRGGLTITQALEAWYAEGASKQRSVRTVSRLVALGASPADALDGAGSLLGDDLDAVRAALDLHMEVGVDPVPMIERAVGMIARRADSLAEGRAASAGAKLSGWMVAGLPLFSLPALPMAHAPLFDAAGLALLFFGLILTAVGMFWMSKLVPVARASDDLVALFADHVAAAVDAGASLQAALDAAARRAPRELATRLLTARRRADLGQPWPDALATVGEFEGLVVALRRAERLGVAPGPALATFAAARRRASERAFEREVRRAPVLMVLPLVLCVLPAFGMLAVLPFLRGITLG